MSKLYADGAPGAGGAPGGFPGAGGPPNSSSEGPSVEESVAVPLHLVAILSADLAFFRSTGSTKLPVPSFIVIHPFIATT